MPVTTRAAAASAFVSPSVPEPPAVITPTPADVGVSKRARSVSSSPQPAKKRTRKDPTRAIPAPTPTSIPSSVRTNANGQVRGAQSLKEKELAMAKKRAEFFIKYAQVIRVPTTLRKLHEGKFDHDKLEEICTNLADQPAQCLSARFLGENEETLFVYFGRRVVTANSVPPKPIDLKDQYSGRTVAHYDAALKEKGSRSAFDGLHPLKQKICHIATQQMARNQSLHSRQDATRHEGVNYVAYEEERPGYEGEGGMIQENAKLEFAGVLHLVHAWTQQGNVSKGLYISSDISRSSTALAGAATYYELTQDIAQAIGVMFEAAFPEVYQDYRQAFEAGVWLKEDPGPFLGRAIIYKLQGKLHKDKKDVGPSVCFPTGAFSGGEMLVPQFGTKLLYEPGAVCIFHSSEIFHKVAPFVPDVYTPEMKKENATPGRIGTVMFFPKHSYDVLKGKPPGWGRRTQFGRDEHLIPATHSKHT